MIKARNCYEYLWKISFLIYSYLISNWKFSALKIAAFYNEIHLCEFLNKNFAITFYDFFKQFINNRDCHFNIVINGDSDAKNLRLAVIWVEN